MESEVQYQFGSKVRIEELVLKLSLGSLLIAVDLVTFSFYYKSLINLPLKYSRLLELFIRIIINRLKIPYKIHSG